MMDTVDKKTLLNINTRLRSSPLILPLQQYLHSGINNFTVRSDVAFQSLFNVDEYGASFIQY